MSSATLHDWRHIYAAATRRSNDGAFRAAFAEAAAAAAAAMRSSADELPALALPALDVPAGGALAEAADFVTGSVVLNRMQRRCVELSQDDLRGLIYGGDIVVP